jgi:hypothetical protein
MAGEVKPGPGAGCVDPRVRKLLCAGLLGVVACRTPGPSPWSLVPGGTCAGTDPQGHAFDAFRATLADGRQRLVLATSVTPWGAFDGVGTWTGDGAAAAAARFTDYRAGSAGIDVYFGATGEKHLAARGTNPFGFDQAILLVDAAIERRDSDEVIVRDARRVDGTAAFPRPLADIIPESRERHRALVRARAPSIRRTVARAVAIVERHRGRISDESQLDEEGFTARWSEPRGELVVTWMRLETYGAHLDLPRSRPSLADAGSSLGLFSTPPDDPHLFLHTRSGVELRYDRRGELVRQTEYVPFTTVGICCGVGAIGEALEREIPEPEPRCLEEPAAGTTK